MRSLGTIAITHDPKCPSFLSFDCYDRLCFQNNLGNSICLRESVYLPSLMFNLSSITNESHE